MRLDRRGDMGVSAMIIFIAMVLVASAAASVILATASSLRDQAMRTGTDAVAAVSTGYDVIYATGDVAGNEIVRLHLFLRLAAGSPDIDINGVAVSVIVSSEGRSTSVDLVCGPANTVEQHDRVEMIIGGLSAGPGDDVSVVIVPPAGFPTRIKIVVPEVLTPGTVTLR